MTTSANAEPHQIGFAFPFRDAKGKDIVDEHVFYDRLGNEGNGNFAVSSSGMWHGGIHVSADGAGKQLDLEHGVRCIADGEVVAYRINRVALASQIAAGDGKSAQTGHYSSAFTLVRHTLEYPANNRLTFFSLSMHLQSLTDYQQKSTPAPSYWARSYEVTQHATDKPKADPHHGAASAAQVGLNIHAAAGSHTILGILPHGARVRIGERDRIGKWGKLETIESGSLIPPRVGGIVQPAADKGWVYLGKESGHDLLNIVVSEVQCDQVVVLPQPIRIHAGELIGHLGDYWLPADPARDNRMVHIEVFCDSALSGFLSASQEAAKKITDFSKLPLLRIDRGVKLFKGHSIDQEGANAPETAVVQIYSQAALDALPAESKGPKDDAYGHGEPWWYVTSANSRYEDIVGWVRNRQMPKGRVTRESPHAWKDFETVTGSDAGNPTIFSTVDTWLDHALCEDKPATADASKLKPLACNVYRELSPMRNERQAADELRAHQDNKWLRFRASRLIPKHCSEWASQSGYQGFFERVLKRVAKEPYHDAEMERIKQLVWWDEVKGKKISGFPSNPEVFHIHPIALVGNFAGVSCIPLEKAKELALTITSGFEGATAMDFGAVADNGDGQGMSFGVIQWAAAQGKLGPLLEHMRSTDQATFQGCFDSSSNYHSLESAISGGNQQSLVNWALDQQAHNPNWKTPFRNLGQVPAFQQIQVDDATSSYHSGAMSCVEFLRSISPDLMSKVELVTYCAFYDLAVQQGSLHKAAQQIQDRVSTDHPATQYALVKLAVEERAKKAVHDSVADCFSRRIGILQQSTFTYTAYGHTKSRANPNFHVISKDASTYVCGI